MGTILFEDTIQQHLYERWLYTGVDATPEHTHPTVTNTRAHAGTRLEQSTRRSPYFEHTRTGKQYASEARSSTQGGFHTLDNLAD